MENIPKFRFGRKCVGCPSIGIAGFELVVGPDRDLDLFGPVSVVITDEERVGAIGIVEPAVVGWRDAGAKSQLRGARKQLPLGRHHGTARCERGNRQKAENVSRFHRRTLFKSAISNQQSAISN
jgi:hypothetical protein